MHILYLKRGWHKYTALFVGTLIRLDQYRFNYGRKWNRKKLKDAIVRLPVDSTGNPDWAFMERYMKSLPGSLHI